MMSAIDWALLVLVLWLIFSPPKYDPAIRIKRWMIKNGWDR
jgi:hypothetical protein